MNQPAYCDSNAVRKRGDPLFAQNISRAASPEKPYGFAPVPRQQAPAHRRPMTGARQDIYKVPSTAVQVIVFSGRLQR